MINNKTLKALEFDKILSDVADRAVLLKTKEYIRAFSPVSDYSEAEFLLTKTQEAFSLLYKYSVSGIYYFSDVSDELSRADMGGTLINGELLKVADNLKSARILKTAVLSVSDENISHIPDICYSLYNNQDFEKEISSKIISEDEISDNASPKLFSIRKSIRDLNVKIRERLNSYMRGTTSKYLQDGVVTMRQDRYVIPVKSEYRSFVKGFIHDQSSSGATVFIEPEAVLDLNNQLKSAYLDEATEIRRILSELSSKVATFSDAIRNNAVKMQEIDFCFSRAIYSFDNKCSMPVLNKNGIINIKKGRHPLIDKESVVPVDVAFGEKYNFILITGPNTGGKTVTLKLVGLLCCMAMSGLFIPASDESDISFFSGVYCDIGDEQSIEQSLSTFSSHIKNIINIIDHVNQNSLVLLDELGAGTDPEEGSALALAIIKKLLSLNCFGIITTHYSKLKEFAINSGKIENASMEFDAKNLKPMYKLNVGIPGSSNAIDIAKTLGLDEDIIRCAIENLSDDKIGFENIIKRAEETRRDAENLKENLQNIEEQKKKEFLIIEEEKEKIAREREKIMNSAKQEIKRIVAEKLADAEEIIAELKDILKRAGLESKEVFRASELKNRLKNSKYLFNENTNEPYELVPVNDTLKVGDEVFVKSLGAFGIVNKIKADKKEAEVLIGNMKSVVKLNDLFNNHKIKTENKVNVYKANVNNVPIREINIIGKTSLEAITELENFISSAVMNNLEEIKVIHGVGEGILLKTVREYLKKDKRIKEYRRGKYGEGENGVTIITLK